jgi:hypothetical protein
VSQRIAIEDVEPDHYVAWALDDLGVFGSGRTREAAIADVSSKVGGAVEVAEEYRSRAGAGDYIINAFFEDDLRPVTAEEIARATRMLEAALSALRQAFERRPGPDAADILRHVSQAERWYFDRLDLSASPEELPEHPLRRLEATHRRTVELLPRLVRSSAVTERSGEKWSPRKVLRRTLWHRKDHLAQIERAL